MVTTEETVAVGTASEAPVGSQTIGTASDARPEDAAGGKAPEGGEQSSGTAGSEFYIGSYKSRDDAEKGFREKDETINRLKSDADRAYHVLQQLAPHFEYDAQGNVLGLKGQVQKPAMEFTPQQIPEALLDPERAPYAVNQIKSEVRNEIRSELSNSIRLAQAEAEALKIFPELSDPNSEIFKTTQQEYLKYPIKTRQENPELVLTAAKAAHATLLAQEMPVKLSQAEQNGRNSAYRTRLQKGGSSSESGQGAANDAEISISSEERKAMKGLGISEERWLARKKQQLARVQGGR